MGGPDSPTPTLRSASWRAWKAAKGQDPQGPRGRSPWWGGGAGTKGRRTAEPSLNKDWVGGGLSLRSPPPAAPAEHRSTASMAGARAALLLPLLLQLGSLALAARGESRCPGCAPTSVSTQQTVGQGQTTSPAPPGLLVPGQPGCSLSLRAPRRWASRGRWGAVREGFLVWARSSRRPCQGVLSSSEAEAVLVSGCLKLIICIEKGRGRGECSLWDLTLSCQAVAFGVCTKGWSLQGQGRRRLGGRARIQFLGSVQACATSRRTLCRSSAGDSRGHPPSPPPSTASLTPSVVPA